MTLKPWRELAVPHRDVLEGTLQQAEFAADLMAVHEQRAMETYQDPKLFFRRTFITEGMRLLLTSVAQRLNGQGGDPVLQLQTAFGGGKTHTLLAVYHLAKAGDATQELPGIPALLDDSQIHGIPRSRVAVLDGKTASIHVGDTVRYLEQRTSGIGGTSVTIGSVDVGVVVEVTPRMGGDDVIVLDVRPQVNVIVGFTDTGDGGQVPNTSERSIQTVVRLRDGETLAIGGLIREEDMETMSKIPGLGDLPLVGQLFRFKNKQRRNSEVLIFITPTLVSDQP